MAVQIKNLLGLVSILVLSGEVLLARTWTDTKGRAKFSEADRKFVSEWNKPDKEVKGGGDEKSKGDDVYFDAEWPTLISADVGMEIEESRGEKGEYIYMSPHYEFICNAQLSRAVVKRFASSCL